MFLSNAANFGFLYPIQNYLWPLRDSLRGLHRKGEQKSFVPVFRHFPKLFTDKGDPVQWAVSTEKKYFLIAPGYDRWR